MIIIAKVGRIFGICKQDGKFCYINYIFWDELLLFTSNKCPTFVAENDLSYQYLNNHLN